MHMSKQQQAKGFRILFLTELWERFGYYTIGSLLVLFMTNQLGYTDVHAYSVYAAFCALLYVTPSIGGLLADRYLGYCRTLLIGAVLLSLGYVLLAVPFPGHVTWALALGVVGQGFFKSMPYTLLSALYQQPGDAKKIDVSFTLYYLSIQIGGLLPLLFSGFIAQHWGYQVTFFIAAMGMGIGVFTFFYGKRLLQTIDNSASNNPVSIKLKLMLVSGVVAATVFFAQCLKYTFFTNLFVGAAAMAIFGYICFECRKYSKQEVNQVVVAMFLMALGAIFFALYYQQPTSLTLFVERNVDRQLLGVTLPSASFWVFNPMWMLLLGPLLSYAYSFLNKRNKDLSVVMKFGIGNLFMGLGYFIIVIAARYFSHHYHVSAWWIVLSYAFQSIAELLVSALGFAMVARLSPKPMMSVMMGMWLVSTALGGVLSGSMASMTAIPKSHMHAAYSLHVYAHAFGIFGWLSVVTGVLTCLVAPYLMRFMRAEPEPKLALEC